MSLGEVSFQPPSSGVSILTPPDGTPPIESETPPPNNLAATRTNETGEMSGLGSLHGKSGSQLGRTYESNPSDLKGERIEFSDFVRTKLSDLFINDLIKELTDERVTEQGYERFVLGEGAGQKVIFTFMHQCKEVAAMDLSELNPDLISTMLKKHKTYNDENLIVTGLKNHFKDKLEATRFESGCTPQIEVAGKIIGANLDQTRLSINNPTSYFGTVEEYADWVRKSSDGTIARSIEEHAQAELEILRTILETRLALKTPKELKQILAKARINHESTPNHPWKKFAGWGGLIAAGVAGVGGIYNFGLGTDKSPSSQPTTVAIARQQTQAPAVALATETKPSHKSETKIEEPAAVTEKPTRAKAVSLAKPVAEEVTAPHTTVKAAETQQTSLSSDTANIYGFDFKMLYKEEDKGKALALSKVIQGYLNTLCAPGYKVPGEIKLGPASKISFVYTSGLGPLEQERIAEFLKSPIEEGDFQNVGSGVFVARTANGTQVVFDGDVIHPANPGLFPRSFKQALVNPDSLANRVPSDPVAQTP